MPVCPNCKDEFRARKGGECPGCRAPIILIEGQWFLDTGNVKKDFVLYWADLQANKLRIKQFITKKSMSYPAEIKHATKLLASAGSYEIATRALNLFYIDNRFNWMNLNSLSYVFKQWDAAVAVARDQLEREQKEMKETQAALDRTPRLDIWETLYDNN